MKIGYVILWCFVAQQSFYHSTKIIAQPKFRTFLRKVKAYFFDYKEAVYETEKLRRIDKKKDNILEVLDNPKERETKE